MGELGGKLRFADAAKAGRGHHLPNRGGPTRLQVERQLHQLGRPPHKVGVGRQPHPRAARQRLRIGRRDGRRHLVEPRQRFVKVGRRGGLVQQGASVTVVLEIGRTRIRTDHYFLRIIDAVNGDGILRRWGTLHFAEHRLDLGSVTRCGLGVVGGTRLILTFDEG